MPLALLPYLQPTPLRTTSTARLRWQRSSSRLRRPRCAQHLCATRLHLPSVLLGPFSARCCCWSWKLTLLLAFDQHLPLRRRTAGHPQAAEEVLQGVGGELPAKLPRAGAGAAAFVAGACWGPAAAQQPSDQQRLPLLQVVVKCRGCSLQLGVTQPLPWPLHCRRCGTSHPALARPDAVGAGVPCRHQGRGCVPCQLWAA